MFKHFTLKGVRALALSVIAGSAIFIPATSDAASHFAGGGGGHAGFAGHGGYAGRSVGGYGYRGGYGRGFYGGGYRGYYGYRGGWGYGWGWPTGLFLASLPLYYSTWWYNGIPYYYADNSYYVWDGTGSRYQQVAPPGGLMSDGAPSPTGSGVPAPAELFAYPKDGQSAQQQARDKQDCRDWAAAQSSTAAAGAAGAIAAATPQNLDASVRAQTACLEGRGYSVK